MDDAAMKELAHAAGKRAINAGMKNDHVKHVLQARAGKASGGEVFVVEGIWLNTRLLETAVRIDAIYICPELIREDSMSLVSQLMKRTDSIFLVSEKVYQRIGESKSDQGLIALCQWPEHRLKDIALGPKSYILVLDGLETPGNVGTIIRTADGAGASAVIICNRRTGKSHPKVVRASLGTILDVPVVEAEMGEVKRWLDKNQFALYFADTQGARAYSDVSYADRSAIVVGNERYGINEEWYSSEHQAIFIPMLGKVDSLNVGVATSIIAYEVRKQFGFERAV